jgi:hypothetical protein
MHFINSKTEKKCRIFREHVYHPIKSDPTPYPVRNHTPFVSVSYISGKE